MPKLNTTQTTLIKDLIRFDTTSSNSNLELIDYVANRLEGTGATVTLTHNADRTKANLIATVGPQDTAGGIILSGHTDTVPVAGQNWQTNPYKVTERDGKLFARGSVDMKGFDALALSQLIETAKQQDKLQRPLTVALTYDEEIGCFGAQDLVRDHAHLLGQPELILVGEPTELKPIIAHKGIHCFEVEITGKSAHSSNPANGVNAIEFTARAIGYLLEDKITDLSALRYPDDPEAELYKIRDDRFDPPHSTFNVGTINGGSAINITAERCGFSFETRPIPGDDANEWVQWFEGHLRDDGFFNRGNREFGYGRGEQSIREYVSNPPFEGDVNAPGTKFLIEQLEHKTPLAAAFMTEASAFQNAGFNTVVCGPGSINQAHQPDEFITVDQLERGAQLLERVAQRCFQPV
jgi:acetylornithine deacetylase